MKLKMLVCQAGDRFVRNPGDIVTVDDAEGERMVAANLAVEPSKHDLAVWKEKQDQLAAEEKAADEAAAARQKAEEERLEEQQKAQKLARYEQLKADARSDSVEFAVVEKYEKMIDVRDNPKKSSAKEKAA